MPLRQWIKSANHAIEGILHSAKTQRHVRYHFLSAAAVLFLSYLLGVSVTEFIVISLAVILVLLAEMLNSAIETVVDILSPEYSIHAVTDAGGRFTLQGLDRKWESYDEREIRDLGRNWWVFAVHPDFAEGFCEAVPEDAALEIRLKRGHLIYGAVFDDQGKGKQAVVINAILPLFSEPKPGFRYWGGPREFRPVMTGPDGSYRIPVLPNDLLIEAAPPREINTPEEKEEFGFWTERKRVAVIDCDVEVDFGRPEEYASWHGTLHDPLGAPVGNGRVELGGPVKEAQEAMSLAMSRWATCDEQGRFEVRQLVPGQYSVSVEFPGMHAIPCGKMTFEEPEAIEQDLRVPGGVIEGVVLDGDRREPLDDAPIHVSAMGPGQNSYVFNCLPGMGGRFFLKGVAPGLYRLSASSSDFIYALVEDVEVREGRLTGDVVISLHRGGKVHCRCIGFEKSQWFDVDLIRPEDGTRQMLWPAFIEAKGIFERTVNIEPGTYTAECAWVDKGRNLRIVRQVEVALGTTTELLLRPEDFEPSLRSITLLGQLLYTDGEPVREGKVWFEGGGIPGVETKEDREKTSEVDEEGRFTLPGFKPGSWWVRVLLPENGIALPPQLIIPEDAPGSLSYTLRLHRGAVSGSLPLCQRGFDVQQRLDRYFNEWVVNLLNDATGALVSGYGWWDNPGEDRFRMKGVPPGTYRLEVHREPFRPYVSPPFTLREGEEKDFGEIVMELSPSVIVEVLTPSGQPAESCYAQFPDLPNLSWDSRMCVGKGKYLYFDMPPGPVRFRFKGDGWREKEQTVQIQPDVIEEVRVIMAPE